MRHLIAVLLIAVMGLATTAHAQRQGEEPNGNPRDGDSNEANRAIRSGAVALTSDGRIEFIVLGPRAQSAAAARALVAAGGRLLRQRDYPNLNRRALIFDLRQMTLSQARGILASAAPQTVADLHGLYSFAKGPPRLYAATLIGQPDSPGCTLPASLRIGQIDGPVQTGHPALRSARIVTRSMLSQGESSPNENHGTAVAALLVGQDATGALAGYASGAQLFAANAFSSVGQSEAADVERLGAALDWLIGNRVRVINMSFAGPVNAVLGDLLDISARRGAVLIAAAGNGGREQAVYPAAAASVIAVTAVDANLRRYRSANTGRYIEFAAPGVDLYVATRSGGNYASGTSYAAPIITALAARLAARGVSSAGSMRARLRAQSVDLGSGGRDSTFGWGLVKATGC